MQLPNYLRSAEVDRTQQAAADDMAVVSVIRGRAEIVRKKRADHDELRFLQQANKEAWQ